ncbi:MAG: 1-deoxy-D-xylulose-5-phosphate synthase [Candidatus Coatesbacteria bacterium]|nr:MAG: 1-deoxy-D-xylulose-5-phosphate synthase [Candidatus Coatesbacteria bacterium]
MTDLLSRIDSPADLKELTLPELGQLAEELRAFIIENVSQTGGHLAPSLGVVELTVALHYVLEPPRDKIIWDVGHQAYGHKILTGRRGRFDTLRQRGGISGFPKRTESEYDAYGVGHASTSISAAFGMAVARDQLGEDYRVVAVIGDGALSGGCALEGLNVAGHHEDTDLIVVLNDNEMSISPSVGAIADYLARVITFPPYDKFRSDMQELVKSIPTVGHSLFGAARRLEESIKNLLTPGMLFEALGFRYVGPVKGHDLPTLVRSLEGVTKLSGPVVLHVLTQKGRGYEPAENDATTYHGHPPFDVATGKPRAKSKAKAYTQIFAEALVERAERDERIVAITAAMPEGTGLNLFRERFPKRFYDVGIAEQTAVLLASGLACEGLRPVCAIYSTFLQRAYDQLNHDVCLQKLPVTFALDRGGVVGDDGPTHHGTFDFAYMRHLPNLIVSAPKDEAELVDLLASAIEYEEGPWSLRYPRGTGMGVEREGEPRTIVPGTAELLREGEEVLLLPIGRLVYPALEAAGLLAQEGIEAAVVNARFVKPLDEGLIVEWARRCGAVVTAEDGCLAGGFGAGVLECLEGQGLAGEVKLHRLGYEDEFVEHGTPQELLEAYDLTAAGIASAAAALLGRK